MKFDYARVSTKDQSLALQKDTLSKESCTEIYEEKASGKNAERPELRQSHKKSVEKSWKLALKIGVKRTSTIQL